MSDLPSPLVDFVPGLTWFGLQEGAAAMLKDLITIDTAGDTVLPSSPATFIEVYINAPGAVNITLPLQSLLIQGQQWTFKDTSGLAEVNQITIQTADSDEIDGGSSWLIDFGYGSVTLTWNGTAFSILS